MTVVKINAITVPPDGMDEFEHRFANRAGLVSSSPGFEGYELDNLAELVGKQRAGGMRGGAR